MIDLSNLKDLHLLALKEKDEFYFNQIAMKELEKFLADVKKNEINCFYLMKMMITIFILKFMLEQEVLKVKIGQICSEGCI